MHKTRNVRITQQRCVRETTVAVESNKYYIFLCVRARARLGARVSACLCVCAVCMWGRGCCVYKGAGVCLCACSPTYPACNVRLPWLHRIFRHYLINGTIFGKKSLNIKCVFWFSLHHLFETFIVLRRIQRDILINMKKSLFKVAYLQFLSEYSET